MEELRRKHDDEETWKFRKFLSRLTVGIGNETVIMFSRE